MLPKKRNWIFNVNKKNNEDNIYNIYVNIILKSTFAVGICAEMCYLCENDNRYQCVSNGCGHVCQLKN